MKFRIKLLYLLTRDKKGKPTYLSLLELEQRKPNKLPAKCIEAVEVAAGTFDIVAVCQAGTDWPGPGQTGTDGAKQTMDSDRTIHFYSKIRLGTKCGILLTSLTRFSHSFAFVRVCVWHKCCQVFRMWSIPSALAPLHATGSFNWNSCAVHFNLHFQVLRYQLKSQPYNLLSAQIRGA